MEESIDKLLRGREAFLMSASMVGLLAGSGRSACMYNLFGLSLPDLMCYSISLAFLAATDIGGERDLFNDNMARVWAYGA